MHTNIMHLLHSFDQYFWMSRFPEDPAPDLSWIISVLILCGSCGEQSCRSRNLRHFCQFLNQISTNCLGQFKYSLVDTGVCVKAKQGDDTMTNGFCKIMPQTWQNRANRTCHIGLVPQSQLSIEACPNTWLTKTLNEGSLKKDFLLSRNFIVV